MVDWKAQLKPEEAREVAQIEAEAAAASVARRDRQARLAVLRSRGGQRSAREKARAKPPVPPNGPQFRAQMGGDERVHARLDYDACVTDDDLLAWCAKWGRRIVDHVGGL